ncbi:MAG TPA: hypothetical protein VGB85_22410 [Nannocystis sp.]
MLASAALAAASVPEANATEPAHLTWAKYLVETITPANNYYGDPGSVLWKGENGLTTSKNRTRCAPLLTQLLKKAYSTDMVGWLGCTSPHAATYHDAIEVEDGFELIESISDIKPGDIIAIEYLDEDCDNLTCGDFSGCNTTGHVAIVLEAPTPRYETSPLIKGTEQYSVRIIDSSATPHGINDTRYQADKYEWDDQGVGRGRMRLYVDADDPDQPIVGYTWSTSVGSTYYPYYKRDLVIGRFKKT